LVLDMPAPKRAVLPAQSMGVWFVSNNGGIRAGIKARRIREMKIYRYGLTVAALAMVGLTGCASKKWVHQQTQPLAEQTTQLEDKTATNNRNLHDVDSRAQTGIQQAQNSADTATTNAQNATQAAGQAQTAANDAVNRADTLDALVKGLDSYKQMADVTVTFGFDKSVLTKDDRDQLDNFAAQLSSKSNYILEVTGGTDSTGPAQYNYDLSQRRADAVVQYLASKYSIPARRFYLIGIGKDQEVAPNDTRENRQKNRRVEVQMLSNMGDQQNQQRTGVANPGSGN
jgi:OmpA-OmpF porin, OOP family